MSEEINKDKTPPPTPSSKTPAPTKKELAEKHLAACREYQMSNETIKGNGETPDRVKPKFVGQPGYNPFLYIAQVIKPWEDKLADGSITENDLDIILKIPITNPPDNKNIKITNMTLSEYIKQAQKIKAARGAGVV